MVIQLRKCLSQEVMVVVKCQIRERTKSLKKLGVLPVLEWPAPRSGSGFYGAAGHIQLKVS
jgi:hypothetical protein